MEQLCLAYSVCVLTKFLSRIYFHARQTVTVGLGSKYSYIIVYTFYLLKVWKKREL